MTAVCVHEPDVKLLPGNCTWTLTAKLQMDLWNIQDVPTRGFASVDISLFPPYNMSQAPSYQRDTGSLESSKELDISPWQLCDTGRAWRSPGLVKDPTVGILHITAHAGALKSALCWHGDLEETLPWQAESNWWAKVGWVYNNCLIHSIKFTSYSSQFIHEE